MASLGTKELNTEITSFDHTYYKGSIAVLYKALLKSEAMHVLQAIHAIQGQYN